MSSSRVHFVISDCSVFIWLLTRCGLALVRLLLLVSVSELFLDVALSWVSATTLPLDPLRLVIFLVYYFFKLSIFSFFSFARRTSSSLDKMSVLSSLFLYSLLAALC